MPHDRLTSEADLIAMLAPLTAGAPGAFGLKDDCAQLTPAPGFDLVLKTDPVRAGVHFFADDPPDAIAWKALAVNISDLAAKGAEPVAYLMALSFPEPPTRDWMARFVVGLRQAQAAFGCTLIGGDTDRAPGPLSIAVTVIGQVPTGKMVQRGTARVGDAIFVSGTLGDSGLGLRLHSEAREGRHDLRRQWGLTGDEVGFLIDRYLRPTPRLGFASTLLQHASASMDLSDGLIKDLARMCKASGVGARVESARLPFSAAAAKVLARCPEALPTIVAAGDDYEILAALPSGGKAAFRLNARSNAAGMQCVGTLTVGNEVVVTRPDGATIPFDRTGWDHF